jgi:arylsulfatase A
LFVSADRFVDDPHEAYRAAIEHIDASVGQIMAALADSGAADNTWIIYTSDNGPWLQKAHHGGSARPLRAGKATTYEGGMRVPGIMRWPARIAAGGVTSQVAASIDLLPTIAAVVGARPTLNGPIDGLDISALLTKPNAPSPHDTQGFFYCHQDRVTAVRVGHLKLRRGETPELYDLEVDISESNNLAPERPDDVLRLERIAADYESRLLRDARPAWQRKDKSSS